MWKKIIIAICLVAVTVALAFAGCAKLQKKEDEKTSKNTVSETKDYTSMPVEDIVKSLTIEQKACQMLQPACYNLEKSSVKKNCYGSILSLAEPLDYKGWQKLIDGFQEETLKSEVGIPFIYGQDQVHGVYGCLGAVVFPHNIGLGAANDEQLMYDIGLATADESKLCHMMLSFSPCVAQSVDPRWGRTYETIGSDLKTITDLSVSFTKGLQDGGIAACVKHYFGDGNVKYGTGENSDTERLIDRGDAILSDNEIEELLKVYKAQIDAGVKSIMISHSSLNGVKMHENKEYIDILKNDYGFEGFILSDWNSIQNISKTTYYDQVVTSVNAGIDMLMEPDRFDEAIEIIVDAVNKGDISEDRVDDAVTRIIRVKNELGVFEDPMLENIKIKQQETGSKEYRDLAEKAVEESLVLLKNDNSVLPLKKGASVYIMGPAADDKVAQCGGWTLGWNGSPIDDMPGVTTIEEGFEQVAEEYGITVYTEDKDADKADIIVLAVGEQSYAEWYGDVEDMDLCAGMGMKVNKSVIKKAASYNKPVVALVVAGRQVFIKDYMPSWDAAVMCYLPGSEGQGVARMLCGDSEFKGTLPSPWYSDVNQIGTDDAWLERGYGLKK